MAKFEEWTLCKDELPKVDGIFGEYRTVIVTTVRGTFPAIYEKTRVTGLKKSFLCENDCLKIGTFHKGEDKETSNVEDLSRENVKHIFETAEPTITNVDT